MLGGIPSYTANAEFLKFLYISLATRLDITVLGVDIAIIAKTAVGNRIAVAVVDLTLPAHSPVGVPPCVVIACSFVYMVGHYVYYDFNAVSGCFGAEVSEILLRTVGAALECEVIRPI